MVAGAVQVEGRSFLFGCSVEPSEWRDRRLTKTVGKAAIQKFNYCATETMASAVEVKAIGPDAPGLAGRECSATT
jgi:hypothetical protein